ncbi:MAG TPA: chalcone isomerase family protein [Gammaproteobacteria bacterium]|nr:chalcone isomerase family protein [Gammaproteobacteria bacterium]
MDKYAIKRGAWLLFVLALAANVAQAREIAGVKLAEKINDASGQTLVLNGAGIRYKFIFKIYVAALYLPKAVHSTQAVLDEPGPKRMLMHFLYHKVTAEQMRDGWTDGFSDNLDEKTYKALAPRIKQFNSFFGDLKSGDRVWLDYRPGVGTRVEINGKEKGVIPGRDFMRSLLLVWLGTEPPSQDLKHQLLGQDEDE